jgi:hypothetical protein
MLNVIFRIRLAGALPKGMALAVVKRHQRWAPLLELPLVIITVVALRGGTSNQAFLLGRHADAPPSLLREAGGPVHVPRRSSRKCHAAG